VLAQRQLALEEVPGGWVLRVLGGASGSGGAPGGVPASAQTGERAAAPQ
jgi:hypothetical protein